MKRLLTMLFAATMFVSCVVITSRNSVVAEGAELEQHYQFEEAYTEVAVSNGFTVMLDSTMPVGVVNVTVAESIADYVVVKVENGVLSIGLKEGFNYYISNNLNAYLSPEGIAAYAVSGGSELNCCEYLYTQSLSLAASGGCDISMDNILVEQNLTLAASGGSDISLAGRAEYITATGSGGCDLSFEGGCKELTLDLSGGSDGDFEECESEVVRVEASGGSDASVCATKELRASASGGSDIEYRGEPQSKDLSADISSEISRE